MEESDRTEVWSVVAILLQRSSRLFVHEFFWWWNAQSSYAILKRWKESVSKGLFASSWQNRAEPNWQFADSKTSLVQFSSVAAMWTRLITDEKEKGKEEYSYIAFLAKEVHSKRSGMDRTVLPANNTMPAFPSPAFTRWHHHSNWGSSLLIFCFLSPVNLTSFIILSSGSLRCIRDETGTS